MAKALYYWHSGKFSPSGLAVALVGGMAVGTGLGAAYGVVLAYLPLWQLMRMLGVGVVLGVGGWS